MSDNIKGKNSFYRIVMVRSISSSLVLCWLLVMAGAGVFAEVGFPPIPAQEQQPQWLIEAANTLPHPRQVAWQDLGLTCFIHFGVNTFTDRDWGTGFEDPDVFQPTRLNCEQWVLAARDAGMRMMMLTCKHHDGFCMWQTRYTRQSVASSSWRGGQGDVLRELAQACAKHDMKVGVYLSPADLYQIESEGGLYGNLSPREVRTIPEPVEDRPFPDGHRTFTFAAIDDYNAYMLNQLYEVLTEYGPVHEVWFDGAHPKRKGGQTYNYEAWYRLIRELAPEAVIAIKGPDVRWVGNEGGHGRENEFSVLPTAPGKGGWSRRDLGSRERLKTAWESGSKFHWYPAELDTSIRRMWFYHSREDGHPKGSLDRLVTCYFDAPGNNGVFLLNVPPDRRGLFHESDIESLNRFGRYLRQTFDEDAALGAVAQASSSAPGHGPDALVDGDPDTYWQLREGHNRGWIQLDLGVPKPFDLIDLQEHILSSGQRIEAFRVEILDGDSWNIVGEAGTVGHRKVLRTRRVIARHVRIHITSGRSNASLHSVGLFNRPLVLGAPKVRRNRAGLVHIDAPAAAVVYYTTDGSDPSPESTRYAGPFEVAGKAVVRAVAIDKTDADNRSDPAIQRFDVAPVRWLIHAVSSEQASAGEQAVNAIDGDPKTIWHSRRSPDSPTHPHSITIDFGKALRLKGFSYLPRPHKHKTGCILAYRLDVSPDGKTWTIAAEGEFENMVNNPTFREVFFSRLHEVRYMRLTSNRAIGEKSYASAAEIGVITPGDHTSTGQARE